jgi:predicted CXXCH cytochrome family protein
VQCESCHGPGLDHVNNPDASQPHARITVATNTPMGMAYEGCAECHQGTHHPFVEEWAQSGHAFPLSSPGSRAECISCHTGQGALAGFAPDAEYVEKNAPLGMHVGIVCSVCHDPHGSSNHGQLRHPIDVPDPERNLCMRCHHRRAEPEMSGALRGPHSPEGPLLVGEAGWWPPGLEPPTDRILGTHGTTANPKLCATCHVNSFTVTDSLTGAFQLQVTGHRFEALPCLSASGVPVSVDSCAIDSRSFLSCTTSGCHGTQDAARSAYTTAKQRIDNLVASVDMLLTQVPPGELDPNDGRFTTADGAWFNAELGRLKGSSTHNPFLCEQLLVASIQALRDAYNLPVPNISLELSL